MSASTGVAPAITADRAGGLWIYGLLVLLEQRATFWHPSQRKSDR